jgi:hypothetical protein
LQYNYSNLTHERKKPRENEKLEKKKRTREEIEIKEEKIQQRKYGFQAMEAIP